VSGIRQLGYFREVTIFFRLLKVSSLQKGETFLAAGGSKAAEPKNHHRSKIGFGFDASRSPTLKGQIPVKT